MERVRRLLALIRACENVTTELRRVDDPTVAALADSLARSIREDREIFASAKPTASKSMLASGLTQGLRELPEILKHLPQVSRNVRHALLFACRRAVEADLPGFFDKERERAAQVIARGRIRNEDEWYLVRSLIDEYEAEPQRRADLPALYRLVDSFEGV